MVKNSKLNFLETLSLYQEQHLLTPKQIGGIKTFYVTYLESLDKELHSKEEIDQMFFSFLDEVIKQAKDPYPFQLYHQKIREPFDYYQFGIRFFDPIVDKKSSSILGKERLKEIVNHIKQKHNVIFLANHQTEADPQAIGILLKDEFPSLSQQMIFVAGERVVTDTLAIPFSMGCDLICIYSKRYIDHPPELKEQKQLHNKKSMILMSELLSEGGKCIYVAPSGGRDRRNAQGEIEIAPFDPKSIEMFYLMAQKSKTPTFFYPMALGTYELLPPPEKIQIELGEHRTLKRVGIHMAIGPSIDMEHFPGSDHPNKDVRRKSRADYIWKLVHDDYNKFQGEK
ncbi:MAG: 1-acyl-sn-glycerol-3-phosphate acyltransferase [Verrucomicrobia bacterium]|nr:1-acyl-sn-glycerol-3-phosphate acyltransferase [Verrucomicrobiota bacterium]